MSVKEQNVFSSIQQIFALYLVASRCCLDSVWLIQDLKLLAGFKPLLKAWQQFVLNGFVKSQIMNLDRLVFWKLDIIKQPWPE